MNSVKKKLVIAIDVDDVIVETAPLVLAHYNKTYGTKLELKDAYSKDFSNWNAPDAATAIARLEEYMKTDEYSNVAPLRNAVAAIKRLTRRHELHIITGRTEFLAAATQTMIEEHLPGVFRSVVFTSTFSERGTNKADVCERLGVDVLIDDHLGHAKPVAKRGIRVLLFGDYPWNQADSLPSGVTRVANWQEVERYFDEQS